MEPLSRTVIALNNLAVDLMLHHATCCHHLQSARDMMQQALLLMQQQTPSDEELARVLAAAHQSRALVSEPTKQATTTRIHPPPDATSKQQPQQQSTTMCSSSSSLAVLQDLSLATNIVVSSAGGRLYVIRICDLNTVQAHHPAVQRAILVHNLGVGHLQTFLEDSSLKTCHHHLEQALALLGWSVGSSSQVCGDVSATTTSQQPPNNTTHNALLVRQTIVFQLASLSALLHAIPQSHELQTQYNHHQSALRFLDHCLSPMLPPPHLAAAA